MLSEQEAKEFMAKPLPERFRIFMLSEMCNEDDFLQMMANNNYQYFPILQEIKKKLPVEFFAYFNDLLWDSEYDEYYRKFKNALLGGF